jgi:hypothetical protein
LIYCMGVMIMKRLALILILLSIAGCSFSRGRSNIWIDKSVRPFDSEQEKWINEAPQAYYPIVVVGTSDTLYAFKHLLILCCFMGPAGIYPGYYMSGFSVIQWQATNEPESPTAIFLQGYNQKPAVQSILEITNALLEGRAIAAPTGMP